MQAEAKAAKPSLESLSIPYKRKQSELLGIFPNSLNNVPMRKDYNCSKNQSLKKRINLQRFTAPRQKSAANIG